VEELREKNMNITPTDQAISALRVAPVETLGMSVCTVIALVLFGQDSHWVDGVCHRDDFRCAALPRYTGHYPSC
jgi:hypothetical protein